MINKNIRKIFNEFDLKIIKELDLNIRHSEVSPDIYYRITELFEKK